ncbi:YneF family protein [Streptococcus suis]|nr:YneF family protein [Streptococcus suis]
MEVLGDDTMQLGIGLVILLVLLAFAGGVGLGIFLARKQVENYIADKPVLDENALRLMMSQMGQKPSEAKVQQVLRQIKSQQKAAIKKK